MKTMLFVTVSYLLMSLATTLFAQGGGTALNFGGGAAGRCPNCDYVQIPDPATGELDIGSGDFSICLWIKAAVLPTHFGIILSKEVGGNVNRVGYEIFVDAPDGDVVFQLWQANTFYATSSFKPLTDGKWHHLAAVTTPNSMAFYVDGTLTGMTSFSRPDIANGEPLQFGLRPDLYFSYAGAIDEVSIFSAALDSTAIRDWMHKKVAADHPKFSSLHGYWRLDEGSGASAGDSSGLKNHGILRNLDPATDWVASTMPFSTGLTQNLHNVRAVWASVDSNASSLLSLRAAGLTEDESAVFGHNNAEMLFDTTGVPAGIGSRLKRIWRVETQGAPTGDLTFDTTNLGIMDASKLRLLVDADSSFANADIVTGTFPDSSFLVAGHAFQNGFYYTLAETGPTTSVSSGFERTIPDQYMLYHNYPNPFNPTTNIRFDLPKASFVEIAVYNVLGEKIALLVNKELQAGQHHVLLNASTLGSGVYLYQLRAGGYQSVKKMIVLR